MRRALFRLQYQRLALPMTLVALVLFGGLGYLLEFVARGHGTSADRREVIDLGVALVAALAAAYAGAAPFTRTFKQRQIVFLHALPMRRWEAWLMTTAAALAAYLTFVVITLILRPSLIRHVDTYLQDYYADWPFVILALFTIFAAAAAGALIAVNPAATISALGMSVFSCVVAATLGAGHHLNATRSVWDVVDLLTVLVLPVVIPVLLIASATLFIQGEIFVLRKLPGRIGVFFLAMLMSFVAGDVLARVAAAVSGGIDSVVLSPDLTRVARVEGNFFFRNRRVTILDARTGLRMTAYDGPYADLAWMPNGTRLMARSSASLSSMMIGVPDTMTIERYSDRDAFLGSDRFPIGGKLVGSVALDVVHDPAVVTVETPDYDWMMVAVLRADGRVAQRASVPSRHVWSGTSLGSLRYVHASDGSHVLRISRDIKALPIFSQSSGLEQMFVVEEIAYSTFSSALSALSQIAPLATLPAGKDAQRAYVCDSTLDAWRVCSADLLDALLWTAPSRGDLYRFDRKSRRWNLIAPSVHLVATDIEGAGRGIIARPQGMRRLIDDRLVWIANGPDGMTLRSGKSTLAFFPSADEYFISRPRSSYTSPATVAVSLTLSTVRNQGYFASWLVLDLATNNVTQGNWRSEDRTVLDPAVGFNSNGARMYYDRAGTLTTRSIDGRVISRVVLQD